MATPEERLVYLQVRPELALWSFISKKVLGMRPTGGLPGAKSIKKPISSIAMMALTAFFFILLTWFSASFW
jgi:hypothetical protein